TDNLIVNGTAAADTLTITSTNVARSGTPVVSYAAMESLTVNAGGGADILNVQSTLSTTPVTVNGEAGDDQIVVSSLANATGVLTGLGSALTIDAGPGANTLNVSEFGSSVPDTMTLTTTQVTGTAAPFTVNYQATGGSFSSTTFQTGQAGDTVIVNSA